MPNRKFIILDVIGGCAWIWLMLLLGYFLGNTIPDVESYLLPIIGTIIVVSLIPAIIERLRHNN